MSKTTDWVLREQNYELFVKFDRPVRVCAWCGNRFTATKKTPNHCSDECYNRDMAEANRHEKGAL